jgi:hypothetical protein
MALGGAGVLLLVIVLLFGYSSRPWAVVEVGQDARA